jgi:hypothetical protein
LAPRIQVAREVHVQQALPAGTWIVRSAQPLGRVAAHLLEVETVDSATWWGFLTSFLPFSSAGRDEGGVGIRGVFPILKLLDPHPLALEAHPGG